MASRMRSHAGRHLRQQPQRTWSSATGSPGRQDKDLTYRRWTPAAVPEAKAAVLRLDQYL